MHHIGKRLWIQTHDHDRHREDAENQQLARIYVGEFAHVIVGDVAKDDALDHP